MLSRRELLRAAGLTLSGLAVAPVLSGCGEQTGDLEHGAGGVVGVAGVALSQVARAPADAAARADGAAVVQAFSADLYRQLATKPGNLVCSPYSVAVALAMTRNGARGRTAAEMDTVLHAPAPDRVNRGLNSVQQLVEGRAGPQKRADGSSATVELDVASSLWGQDGTRWLSSFLDALATDYGAGMHLVDYVGDAESARLRINTWTSDQTHDRIPELIPPGVLDDLTRLVLVNAIYLKAPWESPFSTPWTRPVPFTRPDGSTVSTPMMQTMQRFGYATGAGWQAVNLPYAGSQLAMTVVLPTGGPDAVAALERDLDGAALHTMITGFAATQVRLGLPRWTFRTSAPLNDALTALGMPTAFTEAADLSGMTTDEPLAIAAVLHEAFIAVDEEGTEAAAATAVVAYATSLGPEPVAVTVDRPFLFVIHDVETATPLFIGRVDDPTV